MSERFPVDISVQMNMNNSQNREISSTISQP